MFVETIALPRPEWERWHERLRYSTGPPEALIAMIVWDSGDGQVTGINIWETPRAVADFYMERVRPIVEVEGEPSNKPHDTANRSRSISVISTWQSGVENNSAPLGVRKCHLTRTEMVPTEHQILTRDSACNDAGNARRS